MATKTTEAIPTNRYCPACGQEMRATNSRPSTFPTRNGFRQLVCKDDKACAERYAWQASR